MTIANRSKLMQLFDLVLIANELLPEQDRLSFDYSKYEMSVTVYAVGDGEPDFRLFWWVYYEPSRIPKAEPPAKPQEYLTLDQAIERVWEMISNCVSQA
nr:MAG TPA: hypothetical protein [Caudoviricetes sp.]